MMLYGYFVLGVLGLIVGSFLNVVIYRLHTGKSPNGRSHCLSCGAQLRWYELLPLVSYLALRGRCRTCGSRIPLRYFLVELTTAVLFLLLWHAFSYQPFLLILQMIFFSLLVVILVYDLRHFIIPDEAVLGLLLCACVMRAYGLVVLDQTYGVLADDILAALAASGFFAALWLVSRGRWMGLGDAKLTLPLALIAGVEATLSTVILAFWIGAAASVCVMGLQRLLFAAGTTRLPYAASPLRMKSEVPFAPFLIVGFVCAYLLHVDVLAIVFSFTG